jgi:hypothetical protein
MSFVIIPTAEIVREANTYRHYLAFLPGDVKCVVEQAARSVSSSRRQVNARLYKAEQEAMSFHGSGRHLWNNSTILTRNVLDCFVEHVAEGSGLSHLTHDQHITLGLIEAAVMSIEEAVSDLINILIKDRSAEIFVGQSPWVGDDLLIKVHSEVALERG